MLAHELPEAMVTEVRGHQLGGAGKIDGGYFGGYIKPPTTRATG